MSTKRKKNVSPAQTNAPETREPFSNKANVQAIVEALGDGIITFNLTGDVLYYNPAARRILGWDEAGIDPCSLSVEEQLAIYQVEVLTAEHRRILSREHLVHAIQAGVAMEAQEWLVHRPDGRIVCVHVRQTPIRDRKTGAVLGAVHIFHDVTAMRQINAIKDEFISIASHELRAPLQPLIMASRFIQRWIDRPEHKQEVIELAEEIVQQAKRMSRLVLDMMDMTRINAGRFSIQVEPCDIAAIAHNVAHEQYAIHKRTVQVVCDESTIPGVVDGERLWQVITNLVANAIKYSLAPAPVTIMLEPLRENDTPWVRIRVQDRGCGIPADQLPHLFERFYRASLSYQLAPQHQDSLGLGLYISHAIVQGHGGRMTVESVVNEGSIFTAEIPLAPEGVTAAIGPT